MAAVGLRGISPGPSGRAALHFLQANGALSLRSRGPFWAPTALVSSRGGEENGPVALLEAGGCTVARSCPVLPRALQQALHQDCGSPCMFIQSDASRLQRLHGLCNSGPFRSVVLKLDCTM